jgi:hypothetical protein
MELRDWCKAGKGKILTQLKLNEFKIPLTFFWAFMKMQG